VTLFGKQVLESASLSVGPMQPDQRPAFHHKESVSGAAPEAATIMRPKPQQTGTRLLSGHSEAATASGRTIRKT